MGFIFYRWKREKKEERFPSQWLLKTQKEEETLYLPQDKHEKEERRNGSARET